jgi:hypothetical protein
MFSACAYTYWPDAIMDSSFSRYTYAALIGETNEEDKNVNNSNAEEKEESWVWFVWITQEKLTIYRNYFLTLMA